MYRSRSVLIFFVKALVLVLGLNFEVLVLPWCLESKSLGLALVLNSNALITSLLLLLFVITIIIIIIIILIIIITLLFIIIFIEQNT